MSTLLLNNTVTQGTAAAASGAWTCKITDGTYTAAVKTASVAAAAADPSLVVALSPNSPLPAGTATIGAVKVTDGTGTQPAMDVAARRGFVTLTDGTNAMPTGDAAARAVYHRLTDGTNSAAVTASALQVTGDTASAATDAGNPVKIGAKATSSLTAVTTGQRVNLNADLLGNLVVSPYTLSDNLVGGTQIVLTTTSSTAAIAAQGAGVRSYLTSITLSNASTTGVLATVLDGTTAKYSFYLAPSGGGAVVPLPTPVPGTANTAWNVQLGGAVSGGSVYATLAGYTSPR